ncbi:MAG: AzlC family ABC transporter permease [Marivita sp.]|nr:AzlC family ABC transporter permease [Marivita sp.]
MVINLPHHITIMTPNGIRQGMMQLAPIAIFFVPFGIAFGVVASTRGLTATQSIGFSLLTFSSSAQFSTLEFWHGSVAWGSLALALFAINTRNVVMGAALAPWVNLMPLPQRLLSLSLLNDANFAGCQAAFRRGERDMGLLLGSGLVLWCGWGLGAAIGTLAGPAFGNPAAYGFDVVMLCFLTAIVTGMVLGRPKVAVRLVPILVGATIAVLTQSILPQGWNVIVGAVMGSLVDA